MSTLEPNKGNAEAHVEMWRLPSNHIWESVVRPLQQTWRKTISGACKGRRKDGTLTLRKKRINAWG